MAGNSWRFLLVSVVMCALQSAVLGQTRAVTQSPAAGDGARPAGVVLSDGLMRGRVQIRLDSGGMVPVLNLNVRLIRRGQVIQSTKSRVNGEFEFSGVGAGDFSLVGHSKRGIVAYTLRAVADENATGKDAYQVDTLAVPGESLGIVYGIMRDEGMVAAESKKLSSDQASLLGALITRDKSLESEAAAPVGNTSSRAIVHRPVYLDQDNALRGKIAVTEVAEGSADSLAQQRVVLIRGEEELARVSVSSDGSFVFPTLQPGQYGIVVAGPYGFAAVGIEIQRLRSQAATGSHSAVQAVGFNQVTLQQETEFAIVPIPPSDYQAFVDSLPPGALEEQALAVTPPPVADPRFSSLPACGFPSRGSSRGGKCDICGVLGLAGGITGMTLGIIAVSEDQGRGSP